jgi:hypothetical protein
MAWIHANLHFAGLFSYRIPNISPGYALTSPIPSPSSLRLALVDTAIKIKGSVKFGEEIFELVKSANLEIEPPEKVSILKFFIKRLKPSKSKGAGFEESFGVREYCHFMGPMKFYVEISERQEEIAHLFKQLRRLGTTDSLLRCDASLNDKEPDLRTTSKIVNFLKPEISNLMRRPVVTLNEIKEDAKYFQVNPYAKGRRGNPFIPKTFVLPLREVRRGENFVLYEKAPFII